MSLPCGLVRGVTLVDSASPLQVESMSQLTSGLGFAKSANAICKSAKVGLVCVCVYEKPKCLCVWC